MATVLVTGGAGYIGSHAILELLEKNFNVIVLDSFVNSSAESLKRVKEMSGKHFLVYNGDIRDDGVLNKIFRENAVDSVIHFAGLKSVSESLNKPSEYMSVNLGGTINLCRCMENAGVFTLIFSSSATVYGIPKYIPIDEKHPVGETLNPYGKSKFLAEEALKEIQKNNQKWSIGILRYFNPVGAHQSGDIGESPNQVPSNIMPYITQVAIGRLDELKIFGNDYPTQDGTGVRDYIHVSDLVKGHVHALEMITNKKTMAVWNLGTGTGYSVLDLINAFEKNTGVKINYSFSGRRLGDVPICFADSSKVRKELFWKPEKVLDDMISDAWHWQLKNPNGY